MRLGGRSRCILRQEQPVEHGPRAALHPTWSSRARGLAGPACRRPAACLPPGLHIPDPWVLSGRPCLAAPVCRTWRRAAAGCCGLRLVYHVGHAPTDQSFAAWLGRNSRQLGALILSSDHGLILSVLALAAAAAEAAGRPLRLHTLRVLQGDVHVHTAGQLLAHLPHLRCLQLDIHVPHYSGPHALGAGRDAVLEHMAPLQLATQLEELYLRGPGLCHWTVAELLPCSLRRLSLRPHWQPQQGAPCDLSHLKQLTFLQLCDWEWGNLSSQVPPCLQQLELMGHGYISLREFEEELQQVVTAWDSALWSTGELQGVFSCLPNLRAVTVHINELLVEPAVLACFQQLQQVSSLTLDVGGSANAAAVRPEGVEAARSMSSLRRLHLRLWYKHLPAPPALDALTQLTQLRLSMHMPRRLDNEEEEEEELQQHQHQQQQLQRAWTETVGRMTGLQWLSVPAVLLTAGRAWLGSLQQLRVLALHRTRAYGGDMPWLEECSPQVLPPRLQVLGVSGMTAEQAADWQVRHRLRQALGSSKCVVVVGADLDELADPTQQLAGLPQALQKALA